MASVNFRPALPTAIPSRCSEVRYSGARRRYADCRALDVCFATLPVPRPLANRESTIWAVNNGFGGP
jgi:hypothetical protein